MVLLGCFVSRRNVLLPNFKRVLENELMYIVFVREPGDLFNPMFFTFTNTLQA